MNEDLPSMAGSSTATGLGHRLSAQESVQAGDQSVQRTSIQIPSVQATEGQCGPGLAVPGEMASGVGGSSAGCPDAVDEHPASFRAVAADYIQLTKPRIVTMILVTTIASASIAAGGWVPALSMSLLLIATGMVAASAGAANQIWEREIDCKMPRTAVRPLPDGRMRIAPAILYALLLGISGTAMLVYFFNAAAAAAGAITWLLYVLVYTPMKTRTSWNTSVGAVAGALPVMIGYTAVGGELSDPTGWLLLGILAAWQYPHFMAIAWLYRRQYAEAGFCMSTTVDPTGRSAAIQSIAGSIGILSCALLLSWIPGGVIGGVAATVASLIACWPMLRAAMRFARRPNDLLARKLLRSSLLVLPAVLAIVTVRALW